MRKQQQLESINTKKQNRSIHQIAHPPRQSSRSRSKQSRKDQTTQNKHIDKNPKDKEQQQIDMFAQSPSEQQKSLIQKNKEASSTFTETTDQAGYYIPIVGTIIGGKYKITNKLGKGAFGVVVQVEVSSTTVAKQGQETKIKQANGLAGQKGINRNAKIAEGLEKGTYAVKIIRKNQITMASGYRQYKILSTIHQKRRLKRIMKSYDIFQYSGHLCIVCQLMSLDLRTFSNKKQSTLADIRIYAIAMMLISHELRLSKVIHADIKPDNFLFKNPIQAKKNEVLNERIAIDNLKLADFGTSFFVEEYNHTAEQQVARYYRAPQIILGTKIKPQEVYALDIWAMGCSLYQLYTNQFLFNGNNNNQMLKLMMETKGRFSIKMLNKSQFMGKHFDSEHNFLYQYVDKVTKQQKIQKMQVNITTQRDLMNMLKTHGNHEDQKQLQNFRDFLQKCLILNPKYRITPQQAIQHPFLQFQTKLET